MNKTLWTALIIIIGILCCMTDVVKADTSQCYFAVAWDSHSGDAFISDLYVRDITTYKPDYSGFITKIKNRHDFYCSGCYDAGIIRGGSKWLDAMNVREKYMEIFQKKGYDIHYVRWEP